MHWTKAVLYVNYIYVKWGEKEVEIMDAERSFILIFPFSTIRIFL